ncbi:kxDL motif-containing protein CG10681 isoform X1 [Cimex lectularius]|uniref:KxDL domain-containing protein n=1 Tax=Cimex lectularius TaxID=79782 RepID=A0A8I6SQQ9_CIMLE|nr:kxDL motif-containing protein CG10681 isoform X1 [Cimex lectularius]
MTEHTPESDLGSIECFQNYTASEVFIQGLAGMVHQQDVESMIRAQKQMLQRFEKTNEMLMNCNTLCVTRLRTAATEFKKHTSLLIEMRKDLDNIFNRIQTIKSRTSSLYPDAFAAAPKDIADEEANVKEQPQNINQNILESAEKVKDFLMNQRLKRSNSSSSESVNGSHNDSSPCTSDTG